MKKLSSTAVAALLTATLGLSAVAPVLAQDAPGSSDVQAERSQPAERGFRGPQRDGNVGDILGVERGAEAVEIALVRLTHRLDLTEAQKPLLKTLKSEALAAAETFRTQAESLRPTPPAAGETAQRPDAAQMLENRIALEKAHLAALEAVQPAFAAFFDSLTDTQKAELAPARGERADGPQRRHFGQQGENGPRQHPGAPRHR
ncbi:Spy/CpxP family protein refolding chaperone [Devosia sp.]|uniref:Spy/CpxP family protein refolding chaperone n=1 Tax=Devosia sp. TaxID=1871048 RepID=UPI002AFE291D|nr:Spy/CpxP family protein refolding chaperone [Devosia sp.]